MLIAGHIFQSLNTDVFTSHGHLAANAKMRFSERNESAENMPKWIPCGDGFIEADVVRWKESAWQQPKRKKDSAVNLGQRLITAEVIRDADGWVHLLIRAYAIASEKPGRKVELMQKGTEIRRKRTTIERGKPERLLWSDESVRAALVSRFLCQR